jgi:hypothetical protein
MSKRLVLPAVLLIGAALSACASASATASKTPAPPIVQAPSATALPSQAATKAAGTPTALDPCQLLPADEASALAKASFGPGEERSLGGTGKSCTYGANTQNVFTVYVAQTADEASAKAAKASFMSDLQANMTQLVGGGFKFATSVPNLGDDSILAWVTLDTGGTPISGSAIGVVKETVFFGFSDLVLGGPAPTTDALKAEAQTVLGRLP